MDGRARFPERRTADLRKGRVNLAGASYFVTLCARRPEQRLVHPAIAAAVTAVLERTERDGDATFIASTIMPDHVHCLAILYGRLPLGRIVAKLKALTEPAVRAGGLSWQANFFEHRLRPEDQVGVFARYIYLNPYRKGLIGLNEEWPWWRPAAAQEFDFVAMLRDGRYPPSEWMAMDDQALGVTSETVGSD